MIYKKHTLKSNGFDILSIFDGGNLILSFADDGVNQHSIDYRASLDNGGQCEYLDGLDQIKQSKINQVKALRDSLNIAPCTDHQANIISDSTGNVLQTKSYFKFYANRHPSNPLADPSVILQQAQIQAVPYATYKPNGDPVVVSIDSEVASSIITHLATRNNQNYSLCRAKEKAILACTTINELNAIDITTLL